MVDPAIIATEIARIQGSDNPVHQALIELYHDERIFMDVRDGELVWKATAKGAHG
jgi:hypothetical protein